MQGVVHFISGLPRSGATLLAALLRQNARFHAGMSGPLAGLFTDPLTKMGRSNEFSVFTSDEQRQRILHGLFDNYYAESPAEVIFDTNRAWCTHMPSLARLFPDSRVVACVRQLSWIVDSVERLVRKDVFNPSSIFNYTLGGTVYTRANGLAGAEGMVGYPFDALKEVFYGEHAGRLMMVQYERLPAIPRGRSTRSTTSSASRISGTVSSTSNSMPASSTAAPARPGCTRSGPRLRHSAARPSCRRLIQSLRKRRLLARPCAQSSRREDRPAERGTVRAFLEFYHLLPSFPLTVSVFARKPS